MTAAAPQLILTRGARTAPRHTVDIAGAAWPVAKLAVLAVAVAVLLGALLLGAAAPTAVLVATVATVAAQVGVLAHRSRR